MTRRSPRVLVTAGPTHEPIDAVRYLANRSSGRLGEAIAEAAVGQGFETTLLLGPIPREPAPRWRRCPRFERCEDLRRLLASEWPRHDCLIMAAAVADFRPRQVQAGKLRRDGGVASIELESTPDLLAESASARTARQFVVGFALEPRERLEASARTKLSRKGIDAIVANPLETMDSTCIDGFLLLADGRRRDPPRSGEIDKGEFARWLMETLTPLLEARATG